MSAATLPYHATGLWFAGPRQVELRTERVSEPGPGEVIVEAITSLISAGTEMNVYRGEIATPGELQLPTTRGEHPFPVQYGYQVVGKVVAVGPDVALEVGDRVFAVHAHQDRFLIPLAAPSAQGPPRDLVTRLPEWLDSERAAFSNLIAVALNAMLDVPVRFGDVVVVSGLGIVGSFAGHLARQTAGRLVLVDPLPQRRVSAAWVGADAVVAPEEARDAVMELSNGRGADIAVEASGAHAALQSALDVTGDEGTIVVLSYYGSRAVPLTLSPDFHYRRQRIVSSMVGAVGSGLQPRWDRRRRTDVAFELLRHLDVTPLISHRLPFARADEAYRMLDQAPDRVLGVLLEYTGRDVPTRGPV